MNKKFLILISVLTVSCNANSNKISSNISESNSETSTTNSIITSNKSSNTTSNTNYSSIESSTENIKNDYYSHINFSANGKELKIELYNLIKQCDMSKYTYKTCDSFIADANEDPSNPNNLIDFYTGRSIPKDYFPTQQSKPDAWNKEHIFAKSHGNFASMDAGKDIHHLMPTDNGVNGARSNKDFDNCKSNGKAITSYNSYKQKITVDYINPNDVCYTTSSAFEPRDAVKGDVARIIFYMATRYEGKNDGGPDLEINELTSNKSEPFIGKLSTLLEWNKLDPVDDFEMKRNNYIFSIQNNRNPFIDYPELADKIFYQNYNN